MAERLAKFMAHSGVCSRRDAEEYIRQGRVTVNGEVVSTPAFNVEGNVTVLLDGEKLPQKDKTRLWLYYKPSGLVTTHKDKEGRPTVFDHLPLGLPRVISVGRLDLNSEGLLLLTNNGELSRDFTYIDDIIDGIQQIINHPERAREDNPGTPAVVYNIGHGSPMPLMRFIALLEQNLGREAIKEYTGMQAGDVYRTWADTSKLLADYGYVPKTTLEEGIKQFTDWFKNYKSILPDKK